MLDEDQAVTTKDIGSIQEITKWGEELGSTIIMREETKLTSQFRCNGSDAYIQFIDNLLQRKPGAPYHSIVRAQLRFPHI
jgi:Uncharacterized conserved protein (DUF2075).